jgi:excinuclease UvrABC nuclease subunit
MSSGVYRIVNKVNGNEYVGQSKKIEERWKTHQSCLTHDRHSNQHLQNAWNLYGAGAFRFEKLEENIPCEELEIKEKEYIDKLKPEYNIANNRENEILDVFVTEDDIERHPICDFNFHIKSRPAWHAWVYGGADNPIKSISRRKKSSG